MYTARSEEEREFFNQIKEIPVLPSEQTIALVKQSQMGNEEARKTLVYHNLRLILKTAQKYKSVSQRDFSDVFQDGVLGFIKAIDIYDETRGASFSTIAVREIMHSIIREMENTEETIRKPTVYYTVFRKLKKQQNRWKMQKGFSPSVTEIAKEINVSEDTIQKLNYKLYQIVSLYEQICDKNGDLTIEDITADEQIESIETTVLNNIEREEIKDLLDSLKERERLILEMRFGFHGNEPLKHNAIAPVFGVSVTRIFQIEKKALEKLRIQLTKRSFQKIKAK